MPKQLPEDWLLGTRHTLNVRADLGIKTHGVPADLRVKRKQGKSTSNLYAEFLPAKNDDIRAHQGRSKGGTGKRLTMEASMGTPDVHEAGKRAVAWVQEEQKKARAKREEQERESQHSLVTYWERWFTRESTKRKTQRNYARWRRDTQSKWEGNSYGIKHQSWAQKCVEEISALDFEDYWVVLDARRTPTNDMGGTKEQQKTLIRKLLKEARKEFPHLVIPEFPTITHQKTEEVRHLKQEEWERLLKKVIELSGGTARKELTPTQYQALQFSKANRKNQRNWVDTYDCLNLLWFFYLRAEDIPRLKAEWFHSDSEDVITCFLEVTKGDRDKHRTTHYRVDAPGNWRRINKRKSKGYLAFPHLQREEENPAESSVLDNLNFLMRTAMDECKPPIQSKGMTATNIRHTAFRLTLEEIPGLATPGAPLNSFAENGRTSAEMLCSTYLKYIEADKTAKEARAVSKPGAYSLSKGRILIDGA